LKISIITVVLNNKSYLEDCINSVLNQSYRNIEYIVIDGGSTDGTLDVIRKFEKYISKWISEPDLGIYDAMNKGITLATGDLIGILNSDDIYAEKGVIGYVASCFSNNAVATCYGDLVYIKGNDAEKYVRSWKAGDYSRDKFIKGWMPPHPTFFVRRHVYEQHGLFNLNFPLAADYELMLRFLYKYNVSTAYLPKVLVKMRTGGSCHPGLSNTLHNIRENYYAWKVNDLHTNALTFLMKPLFKTFQYINH